jgi:dTDP-4-dehydrorhamnose 3,5-epimerase
MMKVVPTSIPEVLVLEPRVFHDERGLFMESYNRKTMTAVGIDREFVQDNQSRSVQDNQSRSVKNVLRRLHYRVVSHKANWFV